MSTKSICTDCDEGSFVISCTVNKEGLHHSFDGQPAIVYFDGTKEWWLNGKAHRTDGPAIEYPDGTKYWYLNDFLHRLDGPAVEWTDGLKGWFLNGEEAIEIKSQKIIIGKPIEIENDIGIVLRHVADDCYEVLLGNKKVLIAKV